MQPVATQHIEMRKNRSGQERAYIAGTRVRVRDIYAQSEVHQKSPEEIIAALPHLTLGQVHAALSFYFDNRQLILEEIRQDEQFAAQMRAASGPGPLEQRLNANGPGDALPS